jgi:HK97 gp10 family phage protein
MATGVRIEGMEALQDILRNQLPKEAHNLARAATFALAKEVRDKVKAKTPRDTGNLAKSVKARRGRGNKTAFYSDVYFETGKAAAHDGFYWHMVEHGTAPHSVRRDANRQITGQNATDRRTASGRARERADAASGKQHPGSRAQPFVGPVVENVRATLPARYRELVGTALEKKLAREAKKRARLAGSSS